MKSLFRQQLARGFAIIAATLMAAGCGKRQDTADWWQGEQQRIELSHQLELKQYRFEQTYSHDFEQLESFRRSTKVVGPQLISLRQQRLTLGDQIESLEGQWGHFRESAIRDQRQQAMRKTFEKLTLVSGRTFVNASVASIDDAGVTIRHTDGSARLRYADLDAKQRILFGLEADLAQAADQKEARDVAAYESWVETRMLALNEKRMKESAVAERVESANQRTRAARAAQMVTAANVRPLAQPASNVSSRSWSYSRAYSSYRPSYHHVYYNYTPAYNCQSYGYSVYPSRPLPPNAYNPPVVTRRRSFADTTLPSIP